jgi:hypothetical protein
MKPLRGNPGRFSFVRMEDDMALSVKEIAADIKKVLKRMGNPDRKREHGRKVFQIFQWQALEDAACAEQKRLWAELQAEGGPIEDDANLREMYVGADAIILDTGNFAISVKAVAATRFNRDKFVAAVADEFKLTGRKLERLLALVEAAKEPDTIRLTKRVVPVVKPNAKLREKA